MRGIVWYGIIVYFQELYPTNLRNLRDWSSIHWAYVLFEMSPGKPIVSPLLGGQQSIRWVRQQVQSLQIPCLPRGASRSQAVGAIASRGTAMLGVGRRQGATLVNNLSGLVDPLRLALGLYLDARSPLLLDIVGRGRLGPGQSYQVRK